MRRAGSNEVARVVGSPRSGGAGNPSRAVIHSVTLDVSGDVIVDTDADLARLMAQQ